MRECSICYDKKEKFYNLNCCINNLCMECFEQLRNPQCPFCRTLIIHRRFRSMSFLESNETSHEIIFENYYMNYSIDDIYVDTRWFRRHRRRLIRLREREENSERNREIHRQMKEKRRIENEKKKRQQRKEKKQRNRELNEELKNLT